jgi:hypothetical protein
MAHRIKANDGQCCPCAEREGCDCGAPCTTIECRHRGGTAALIGFPELASPSAPPRAYRRRRTSGQLRLATYLTTGCPDDDGNYNGSDTAPAGSPVLQVTWVVTYDIETEIMTFTATRTGGYEAGWFGGQYVWAVEGGFNHPPITASGSLGSGPATTTYTATFSIPPGGSLIWTINGRHAGLGVPAAFDGGVKTFLPGPSRTEWDYDLTETYGLDGVLTTEGDPTDETGLPVDLYSQTDTPTLVSLEGDELCVGPLGMPSRWFKTAGEKQIALTLEDTEAAAIARLLAGAGGAWSDWQLIGVGLGLCAPSACCRATWAARGAGQFTFPYQESEYRVASGGNWPGLPVTIRLRFFRKPSGAPDTAYQLFATEEHVVTANAEGVAQAEDEVPLTQGYDTYLATCSRLNAS